MKYKRRVARFHFTEIYIAGVLIVLVFSIVYAMQRWEIPPFDEVYIYYLRSIPLISLVCNLVAISCIVFFVLLMVKHTWKLLGLFTLHIFSCMVVVVGMFPGFLGVYSEQAIDEIWHNNTRYLLTEAEPGLGIGRVNRVYHVIHRCDPFSLPLSLPTFRKLSDSHRA